MSDGNQINLNTSVNWDKRRDSFFSGPFGNLASCDAERLTLNLNGVTDLNIVCCKRNRNT